MLVFQPNSIKNEDRINIYCFFFILISRLPKKALMPYFQCQNDGSIYKYYDRVPRYILAKGDGEMNRDKDNEG